jgi:hypothetical protein
VRMFEQALKFANALSPVSLRQGCQTLPELSCLSVGLPDEGKEDRLMKPANASAIPPEMGQARRKQEAWRSPHRPRCTSPIVCGRGRQSWPVSKVCI